MAETERICSKESMTDEERLLKMGASLLDWYSIRKRDLPWRGVRNPYYTWVSEIMLQQTRVEAVIPYFERFTQALPDIKALAECEEDKLLKLWEGLGYYSRVRNLQKAAQMIMEEHGGKMPGTYEEVLALKGIGPYTAGAITSIAFDQPEPAVDGNVLRVVSRVMCLDGDVKNASVQKNMRLRLKEVIPREAPGDYNQAMMDLGATVCLPGEQARCEMCPLRNICMAYDKGLQAELPVRSALKKRRVEDKTMIVITDGVNAAIRKRPSKGLLAGLYELPWLEGVRNREEVILYVESLGLKAARIEQLSDAKHVFSHVEWHMTGWRVLVENLEHVDEMIAVKPEDTEEQYPVPSAYRTYMRAIRVTLGSEKLKAEAEDRQ